MKWGADLVGERIAAKHAIKIRAALVQSVDSTAIVRDYLQTHPIVTEFMSHDRARARAWAIHAVKTDSKVLKTIFSRLYAEMYSTGQASAEDYVYRTVKARKKSDLSINWDNWQPGNRAAAALIAPSGGLKGLLNKADIVIQSINQTSYDLLGTQLANGIAIGASSKQIAGMINDALGSTPRALVIARTEGSRASNAAAADTYNAMGISQWEWSATDPVNCDCVDNDGEIVEMGQEFPSGDLQPPAHPNCVCKILPVIPDSVTLDSLQTYTEQNAPSDLSLGGIIGASQGFTDSQNTDNGEGDSYATFAPPSVSNVKPLQSNSKRR